jgi:FkbM family methyltransferase
MNSAPPKSTLRATRHQRKIAGLRKSDLQFRRQKTRPRGGMPETHPLTHTMAVSYPRPVRNLRITWERLKFRLRTARLHPAMRRAPLRTAFRFLTLHARLWLRRPIMVELPRWQARLLLPGDWGSVGIAMIYCLRERYEPELIVIERFVRNGQVVVDAGASCGIYTVALSKLLAGTGRVLAFEPGARAYAALEANIHLNDLTNVRAFRLALADRVGRVTLRHHRFGPVSNRLDLEAPAGGGAEEVEATTLDAVLEAEGHPVIGLLKMDVEGVETLVLRGARATLGRGRPVVLFEYNARLVAHHELVATGPLDALTALGYRFFRVDSTGELVERERTAGPGNIVAIPSDRS